MDLSTLKRWRVLVPSILFALVFAPLLYKLIGLVPKDVLGDFVGEALKWGFAVVFIPIGYLYDVAQIRGVLNRASHQRINLYVEDQLRLTLQPLLPPSRLANAPRGDKRWLRLLYRQVDLDPTLSEIAKRIRDNGLRWTTAADIATIFVPGGVLTGILASALDFKWVVYWGLLLALIGFLSAALIPTLEKRHIDECADQQDHIRLFRSAELMADFDKVFPP